MAISDRHHRLVFETGGGLSMAEHMRTELVLTALEAALGQRHPAPTGLLFHSDRKSELIHPRICSNRTLARTVIAEWIEVFYDRQRLHSTIG